jgi:arsenate reductase
MEKLKIYEYANCSTCKQALKFLDVHEISYERVAIVANPPTKVELRRMLRFVEGDIKKLFNVSGQLYREMKLSETIGQMTVDECLALLSQYGKLVKRPFLIGSKLGFVGFKEAEWKKIKPIIGS